MNDSIRAETLGGDSGDAFDDRPSRWFLRGTAVGMLLMAAVNALSYFARSAGWGNLVGPAGGTSESLGFPLIMWASENSYGGMFVDYTNLGWNIMFAAVIGSFLGLLAAKRTEFLNSLFEQMQTENSAREYQPVQFSLRGMMIVTGIVAVASMLAKNYAATPPTLVAIYTLGPLLLVVVAMLPRKLEWQTRVKIIIPATLTLIAVAIAVGVALGMEFDKVMMGVFLCWTPQSVIAAVGLSIWVVVGQATTKSVGD